MLHTKVPIVGKAVSFRYAVPFVVRLATAHLLVIHPRRETWKP